MSFRIDNEKLLEKYKTIWTTNKDLKYIELNALPFYDNRYIKPKIRTYGDKVNANFRGLNVPENDIECESTVISIYSSLACEIKQSLQFYLDDCAYKIVNKLMIDDFGDNLYGNDEDQVS